LGWARTFKISSRSREECALRGTDEAEDHIPAKLEAHCHVTIADAMGRAKNRILPPRLPRRQKEGRRNDGKHKRQEGATPRLHQMMTNW